MSCQNKKTLHNSVPHPVYNAPPAQQTQVVRPFAAQPVFMPNRANPFIPNGGSVLWNDNDLLLKDPALRARSGVVQLDQGVTDAYATNTTKQSNL